MTKLEEMCRTYWAEKDVLRSWDEMTGPSAPRIISEVRAGIAAVLRKHIEPMIAEAYSAGWLDVDGHGPSDEGKDYAARIISDLIAPEKEHEK